MRFSTSAIASVAVATMASLASLPSTGAVLYGDEGFGDLDGNFWAFYSGGVAIIDPDSCQITSSITTDSTGTGLPTGWSDGIYMQYDADNDGNDIEGYVLINSRVPRTNATGDAVGDVYVFNTVTKTVETIVEVGPRVVHSYGVHNRNEFWTHSDGDGHFYVIDLSQISTTESKVQAHANLPAHGKLLWDEDGTLGNRGFATSTAEQYLFEVDIATAKLTTQFDYSSFIPSGVCRGLHAISYSSINKHVYAECSGGGGILEFDVGSGSIAFVHQHATATGALYEVPDGTYVVATNKGGNMLHVFKPNGMGQKSSIAYNIPVDGHPSTPTFYPTDTAAGGADFIACMPLTSNPNRNQMDAFGNVVCDYYNGCTGAVTADAVSKGVCSHTDNPSTSADPLTRVTTAVDAASMPYCARCANPANFVNGTCVCSPSCGSCDTDFPLDYSKSGVACVDLGAVVDGTATAATVIPDTGAVRQGSPYGSSRECTYGRTYRGHKRGEKYDASVANFPTNGIVIVDMSTQTKKCHVDLPAAPARVVFAPKVPTQVAGIGPQSGGGDDMSSASGFSTSAIVLLAGVASAAAAML